MQKVLTNFSQLSSKACRVSTSPVFKRDLPSIGSEKKSRDVWGSCQIQAVVLRFLLLKHHGTSSTILISPVKVFFFF